MLGNPQESMFRSKNTHQILFVKLKTIQLIPFVYNYVVDQLMLHDDRMAKSFHFFALATGIPGGRVPIAIITMPAILPVLALLARIPLVHIPGTILAMPVVFPVLTLTRVALVYISIAVLASPVVLPVLALAGVALGVIEVTVIATPSVFSVAALARVTLGGVPPIGRTTAAPAAFHVVTSGVAEVAGGTGPVVLPVLAFITGIALLHALLTVLAVPLHSCLLYLDMLQLWLFNQRFSISYDPQNIRIRPAIDWAQSIKILFKYLLLFLYKALDRRRLRLEIAYTYYSYHIYSFSYQQPQYHF